MNSTGRRRHSTGMILTLMAVCGSLPARSQAEQAQYEAWLQGVPQGVAISAWNLTPDQSCMLEIYRADGNLCRASAFDSLGRQLVTDATGMLVTRNAGAPGAAPVAWACLDGNCAGTDVFQCHDAANPLSRVVLTCDSSREFPLVGPQDVSSPTSAALGLPVGPAVPAAGSFLLIPTLYSGNAAPRALCTVAVDALAGEDASTVLARGASAVEQSATCMASGVTAGVESPAGSGTPRLRLMTTGGPGTELVPGLHVEPGNAVGRCFSLTDLGVPSLSQSLRLAIRWMTGPGGAVGGEVRILEGSAFGTCSVRVPTVVGQSAEMLASAIHLAFHQPGMVDCPALENPLDVVTQADRTIVTVPSMLEICTDDSGIGFSFAPDGLAGVPPAAVCRDQVVECTGSRQAQVTLDASGSTDPDPVAGGSLIYEWYQDYGQAAELFLGSGEMLNRPFALGPHAISVVVTDESGRSDRAECTAHVVDTMPPVIVDASLVPAVLHPPNHEMVDVGVGLSAYDECTPVIVELESITSSEPDDAPGDGDGETSFDIEDAAAQSPDYDFRLRAERDRNGPGRTYRVSYRVRDEVWNTTTWTLDAIVPVDPIADPIRISVAHGGGVAGVTTLTWTDDDDGTEYDVVRGDLRNVATSTNSTYMGPVECLAVGTPERRAEDPGAVSAGEVAFYLVGAVRDGIQRGFSTESARVPRVVPSCRATSGSPIPDPERNSDDFTTWGWLTGATAAQVGGHLAQYAERLVDIDRLGPDLYQTVQVRNAGATYGTPAFWWTSLDEAGVIAQINAVKGRILDLEPFVVNGQTRFTVSMIPNEGKRAKAWWWSYDRTQQEVIDAINLYGMRLIDLEVYDKNGQTMYAYVGIANTGVDATAWWFYFDRTFEDLGNDLSTLGARLIDIEVLPGGHLAAIMVQNDGTYWWWGVGLTAADVGSFTATKASRLVDLERFAVGSEWRYAFVSIDDASTAEGRRLRPFLDALFDQPQFGGAVRRGLLVKESNGPVIVDIAGALPFQPASTLKLLPYLYAITEIDRLQATMDNSFVDWFGDPANSLADCLTSGVPGSASFRDALPSMMWYSHNRTLDAFFDLYPPYSTNPTIETLTSRAQNDWGMTDTWMYYGCPGDWLANRSTLYDIAKLYEGVESEAFFIHPLFPLVFWHNMINQMQGNCLSDPVGTGSCTCPPYDPGCPGNYYISPYIGDTPADPDSNPDAVGPIGLGGLFSVVQSEGGPTFPVSAFMDNVLMRSKGGGAAVGNYPIPGFWDGYASNSLHVTLPFKDGYGNIVPRTFVVAWFINHWDAGCGIGNPEDASCKAATNAENAEGGVLFQELLRIPIRMAVATW